MGSGLACANCTTILYNGDISNNVRDMKFVKASGLTESEKILADLCNGSFLQLWTYPNLFSKPGKELCDLRSYSKKCSRFFRQKLYLWHR